ncbi:MAG: PHP domain-containing protein [bacterium]|nr:PHP domain-containing protein [bacterium]
MEDMHIHLKNAIYEQNLFDQYVKRCIDIGIEKVVFLDHGNRISNKHKPVLYTKEAIDSFNNKISIYRNSDKSVKLTIIKGIEIDYSNNLDFRNETLNIIQYGQFEWIIGAIHSIKFDNLGQYLKSILDMLDNYPITAIAHIKMDKDYKLYQDLFIDILNKCHEKNVLIEINTSNRARWSDEQLYYMLELMRKYKVDFVYSSDAHSVDDVGYMIRETSEKVEKWKKRK